MHHAGLIISVHKTFDTVPDSRSSISLIAASALKEVVFKFHATVCTSLGAFSIAILGSFHAQSPKNFKDPPQILTKLGVFGVPMVLITCADF